MDTPSIMLLLLIIAAINIFGLLYSGWLGFNIKKEHDTNVDPTIARHKILGNPVLWAYVLVLVAIFVGYIVVYVLL